MGISRRQSKRMWYAGLVTLWLFPFVLVASALAGSGDFQPPGSSQGWFWRDRPIGSQTVTNTATGEQITSPDPYTYPISASGQGYGGGLAEADWPGDHMYVGWDGAKKEAEMFSGVAFALSSKIPSGSTITKFDLTVVEHPGGNSPSPHKTTVAVNGSGSRNALLAQGIVACPYPQFYGGSRAAPMPTERADCSKKVVGQPTLFPATETFTTSTVVAWKFDLTPIAQNWADDNPAFSLEPNTDADKQQAVSWRTVFHQSGYTEGSTLKPGVFANVEWREGSSSDDESFEETFGDLSGGSFSPGFEDGLVEDLSETSDNAVPNAPAPLAAGFFEGEAADFWDIPFGAWAAAIVGMLLLGASGWSLQQDPAGERPPGAASALMRESK